jgi:hypothetical protein
VIYLASQFPSDATAVTIEFLFCSSFCDGDNHLELFLKSEPNKEYQWTGMESINYFSIYILTLLQGGREAKDHPHIK